IGAHAAALAGTAIAAAPGSATFTQIADFPGLGHVYVSYAKVDSAPFGVFATLSSSYVAAETWRRVQIPGLITVFASIMILLGGFLITRAVRRSLIEAENTRRALHAAEAANEAKRQFLANMSHELRTPMNAVLGFTEMMSDGLYGQLPDKALKALERVQANGRHLLGLINDVLDLSKIEAGQLTLALDDYSIGQVVQTVLSGTESLAKAKGLALTARVQEGLPIGRGDERRLTQVLLNLVGNAIKFTDKGSVEIAAGAADGFFDIAVRDTGPGIAPDDQKRIFEEFQQVDSSSTRQKGGTGLGLAISQRLVEMHGGTIAVESVLGEGSTFRIAVPVRAAERMEAA
ncbi:MAG: sensor histidine kinase, partial [Microvirga sp.]